MNGEIELTNGNLAVYSFGNSPKAIDVQINNFAPVKTDPIPARDSIRFCYFSENL